jgi:hypothetical protein
MDAGRHPSNPLAEQTGFFDIKFPAELEEDLVVNHGPSAQSRQFITLGFQQCPGQPPQRLIFVEQRRESGWFQIALQGLNLSLVTKCRILQELGWEFRHTLE